jgi:hypothetical protein
MTRGRRLRRAGKAVASIILHIILVGIVGTVVLTITTRDIGLLLAAVMLTIIFFFELVFKHNVSVGRIPQERVGLVRILMLPIVYLAAMGLSFPFFDAPGVDPIARLAVLLGFFVLSFLSFGWAIVVARRMRRDKSMWTVQERVRH